jgi:hypothetical protein
MEILTRMTNPLDRKLVNALKLLTKGSSVGTKREKLERSWSETRDRMADDDVCGVLDALWKRLSPLPEKRTHPLPDEVCSIVQYLRDGGFLKSAELLFVTWAPVINSLNLEQVLRIAPTATALKAWCKGSKILKKEMERQLLANVALAYENLGGDWLLANSKADKLMPLIDRLLARQPRPKFLPSWQEALTSIVKKDTRGVVLASILRSSSTTEDQISALAEAILSHKSALRTLAEVLPVLIAKEATARKAADLTARLFSDMAPIRPNEREFRTVIMARIGSGVLLLDPLECQAKATLDAMANTVRHLRLATYEPMLQSRTWVLQNLRQETLNLEGGLQLTSEWIRHLASAFENAPHGFSATEVLTVMANNLGLTSVGTQGEVVSYDPIRHEDLDGGMLPGDPAFIEKTGLAHDDTIAIRAKVKKAKELDHV